MADSDPWHEITMTFRAPAEDAEKLFERVCEAACGALTHRWRVVPKFIARRFKCRIDWVAGMRPAEDVEDAVHS